MAPAWPYLTADIAPVLRRDQAARRGLRRRRDSAVRPLRQRGPRLRPDREGGHDDQARRPGDRPGGRCLPRRDRRGRPEGRPRNHAPGPQHRRCGAVPRPGTRPPRTSGSWTSPAIAPSCAPAPCAATDSGFACARCRRPGSGRCGECWRCSRGAACRITSALSASACAATRGRSAAPCWRGDFTAAVALIVGRPTPDDAAPVRRARELTAAGRYARGRERLAERVRGLRPVVPVVAPDRRRRTRALFGLDRSVLGFYVSAYQSWLFNRVLAERVADLDRCLSGEIAFWHRTGRFAPVSRHGGRAAPSDAIRDLAHRPHARRHHVPPSGRGVGDGAASPRRRPDARSKRLPRTGPLTCVGGRRPLRFRPEGLDLDTGEDDAGSYLELGFTLPPGCYATALLREICKDRLQEGPAEPDVA